MTDSPQDDARLRATEAQMRHALGLHGNTPSRSTAEHPTTSTSGSQPQRRRFVRDGEVPVTVIRRDHQPDAEPGINQLDAARQAVRSEAMAESGLSGRWRRRKSPSVISRRKWPTNVWPGMKSGGCPTEGTGEQAVQQTLLTVQAELVAERLAHRKTDDALTEAQEGRLEAEAQLRQAIDDQQAQRPTQARHGLPRRDQVQTEGVRRTQYRFERHATGTTRPRAPAQKKTNGPAMVDGGARAIQARRRGRPAKAGERIEDRGVVETAQDGHRWRQHDRHMGKRGRGRPKGSKNRPKP